MQSELITDPERTVCSLWVLAFLPLVLWGCGAVVSVPSLAPNEIPQIEAAGSYRRENYRFEPGDTIQIGYTFHPEMSQQVVVQPDGKITAALVGEITVSGMTAMELRRLLVVQTSDRLRDPEIVVTIARFAEKHIYVLGEVDRPGEVPYRDGLTPLQAIAGARGFVETARLDSVVLIRRGWDNADFVTRKLNLAETVYSGSQEPLHLAPNDILFVPRTPIAEVNLWIRQHFTEIIRGAGQAMPRYSIQ